MNNKSRTKDRATLYTDEASIAMWARHMRSNQKIRKGSKLDKTVNKIIVETGHIGDLDLAREGVRQMGEVLTTALLMADQHVQRVNENSLGRFSLEPAMSPNVSSLPGIYGRSWSRY